MTVTSEQQPPHPLLVGNHSKVIRHEGGFNWNDIPLEPYKETTETWKGITRRELSGKRGESQRFHVRWHILWHAPDPFRFEPASVTEEPTPDAVPQHALS